jgi:hypothetical protein
MVQDTIVAEKNLGIQKLSYFLFCVYKQDIPPGWPEDKPRKPFLDAGRWIHQFHKKASEMIGESGHNQNEARKRK